MSTQNENVARFARNVEWDIFCDFQTPYICVYCLFPTKNIVALNLFMIFLLQHREWHWAGWSNASETHLCMHPGLLLPERSRHLIIHIIRKVKFLSKNSILTKPKHFHEFFIQFFFLTIFLVKSKLSTAKMSKTTTFSRVFHPFFFDIFFSWNQSCQQLKSPKPQHFREFFTPKNRQFSRKIKVEFLDKKWRFRTVCENSDETIFWIFKHS